MKEGGPQVEELEDRWRTGEGAGAQLEHRWRKVEKLKDRWRTGEVARGQLGEGGVHMEDR